MSSRVRRILFLTVLLPGVVILLAGCGSRGKVIVTPAIETTATMQGTPAAAVTPVSSQAPYVLSLVTSETTALDPVCSQPAQGLELRSAPIPATGLELGADHLFCAVGAADGAGVAFTLTGPDGSQRSYEATSTVQEGASVATLNLRLTPDDTPGPGLRAATTNGEQSELSFEVRAATGPFIALTEPVGQSRLIHAAIGGLPADSPARFALYSLGSARPGAEANVVDGNFLISRPA